MTPSGHSYSDAGCSVGWASLQGAFAGRQQEREHIREVGFMVFTVAGVTYIAAPFHQDFDVRNAPESPPSASIVASLTATQGTGWDASADTPIEL